MSDTTPTALQQYIDNDTVFVCIDIEAHCLGPTKRQLKNGLYSHRNERRVCEVGVCVLDSRHINGVPLGDRGVESNKYFEGYELGIKEARHDPGVSRVNCHRLGFCTVGLAEDFKFGEVQWISKHDMLDTLVSLIKAHVDKPSTGYISNSERVTNLPPTCNKDSHNTYRTCCQQAAAGESVYRPVVYLYFARTKDGIWLREHDVDLVSAFPNSQTIDIQKIYPSTTISAMLGKSQCSAGDLLNTLGIPSAARHNGGNDAFYELQAYIAGLCLTSEQRGTISLAGRLTPALPEMWNGWAARRRAVMEDVRARAAAPLLSIEENAMAWPSLWSTQAPTSTLSQPLVSTTSFARTAAFSQTVSSPSSSTPASSVMVATQTGSDKENQPGRASKNRKKKLARVGLSDFILADD